MSSRARRRDARVAALLLALLVTPPAASQEPSGGPNQATRPARIASGTQYVDRAALMALVRALSAPELEGRRAGTTGGRRARGIIIERFSGLGLAPAGTSGYLQPFRPTDSAPGEAPGGSSTATHEAANVVGRIDGTAAGARAFVITAHYDHLGRQDGRVHPGADDNASGVAALVAVARHFTRHPPRHPLVFAALDAEELDLQGAEHFLAHSPVPLARIALTVNLDMVSRSDRHELYAAGTFHTPELRPLLEDVQRRSTVTLLFGHDRPETGRRAADDWTTQSDHGAFHRRGIPFVYFGVEDHADYHQPTDTADRIDPGFFGAAVDTIIESLRVLDARIPPSGLPSRR